MSKLTIISSRDMAKLLGKLGFEEIRQRGSHKNFKHKDGRATVIPFHGEYLGRGLIRKILNDIDLSVKNMKR
jgi:predicted RNA binding protein YcfA (HicA-like mRNA interferase family)